MPSLEALRDWFRGHDVEGLPSHPKPPRSAQFSRLQDEGYCEQCKHDDGSERWGKRAPVMTAYEWDGKGKDPNLPPILCDEHMEMWCEHWTEMWNEYYSDRI